MTSPPPVLIAMCGLPGSGKSAMAQDLGRSLAVVVVSVDPIEAALLGSGIEASQPTGLAAYMVAEAIAADQLRMGSSVIVDAVNDAVPAREQWIDLAARHRSPLVFIEIRCTDQGVHRARLAGRVRDLENIPEPTWDSVQRRRPAFDDWSQPRLILDSLATRADNLAAALAHLAVNRSG